MKPETQAVLLQSRCMILTTSGEYPDMPWGDNNLMDGGMNHEDVVLFNNGTCCYGIMQ